MGNGLGRWFLGYLRAAGVAVARPKNVDILCIDAATFDCEDARDLFKKQQNLANKFIFVAADGPVTTAKVLKGLTLKGRLRFPGQSWAEKLPNAEAPLDVLLTEKSKELAHTRIVYSHKFVIGEADYKIGEFYCNWARSPSYTTGLTYLVESCDSDVLFVTLGFHEAHCFFVLNRQCFDIGATRRHICKLMGGGDVRRRVDDFRALATFAQCDFRCDCGRSPEELIAAYKTVTKDRQDFLVDGDNWNVGLLKEFFNELAK